MEIINKTEDRFTIIDSVYVHGFYSYMTYNKLYKRLVYLIPISKYKELHRSECIMYIRDRSSFCVFFGWDISEEDLTIIMNDCINNVIPNFSIGTGKMFTDISRRWLGFEQINLFEEEYYLRDLNTYSLILFHNEIINFQDSVLTFVTEHEIYKNYQIIKDSNYRYEYFKDRQKDRYKLSEGYAFYIDAAKYLNSKLTEKIISMDIGCYFLNHSDLFFELLNFSLLKGDISGK